MKQKILLPKFRFEGSPNEDTRIRVNFENEHNIIKNDYRTVILNLSEQYYKEKNECNRYKIFGKLRMIFKNMYIGKANYGYLEEKLSLICNANIKNWKGYLPYNEFAFKRTDILREKTKSSIVYDLYDFSRFNIETTGESIHKDITALNSPYFNWNLYLSYVYTGVTNFPMKYTLSGNTQTLSFKSGDGIVFRVTDNDFYYIFTSPVKHGMNQGEYIIINNKPYYINSVGNNVFNSEKYVIYISKKQVDTSVTFNKLITGKRCLDIKNISGTTSQYYVHKHKILSNYNDYKIDNIGFESPIFRDEKKVIFENSVGDHDLIVERNRNEALIYEFNEPFVNTGLTNNLGYTPNELYVTTIFKNSNGYFLYPPKVGYSFNFHNSWIDEHFNGNTVNETSLSGVTFTRSGYTFNSGNYLSKGDTLFGAFVEYNPVEMKERIISESFHKIIANINIFNHNQTSSSVYSGATETNPFGLYYQPHYRFKIRELSSYIETSNSNNIINLPDNAKYFPSEGLWKWRDIYELGYKDENNNGVDFTYMNDTLYAHNDINFYLRNETLFNNKRDEIKKFKNNSSSSLINC